MANYLLDSYNADDGISLPLIHCRHPGNKRVVLYIHGNGNASCVSRPHLTNALADGLGRSGIDFIAFNNRGSNIVGMLRQGPAKILSGMAYEKIKDCVHDIQGALSYALDKGYETIYLIGHSTGANKICVYDHYTRSIPESVTGYVLLAGGDDIGLRQRLLGDRYHDVLARVKAMADQDPQVLVDPEVYPVRHPLSYGSLVELLEEGSDYDVFPFHSLTSRNDGFGYLKHLHKPHLLVYGERDDTCLIPSIDAVTLLNDKILERHLGSAETIGAADHNFAGHEVELSRNVSRWLNAGFPNE